MPLSKTDRGMAGPPMVALIKRAELAVIKEDQDRAGQVRYVGGRADICG